LCTSVCLSLLPIANTGFAQQDEETVEEIIVTGSFIRRSEGFTQASAVTQINASDLADEGTMNLGEVIQNLTFCRRSFIIGHQHHSGNFIPLY
jgi:iron complex outermembrane recepter protein